jgi:hypothetical protein
MDEDGRQELEQVRGDYHRNTGRPFRWFYCPVLFRDDDVELCKGHVLNQAFVGSTRAWTVQRKDIDNFYGSFFESDFVLIQELGSSPIQRIIEGSEIGKKLPVKVSFKGDRVDSYDYKRGAVPKGHTAIVVEGSSGSTRPMVLKMVPDEVGRNTAPGDWELSVEKDLRLESLVSLIKAAHLTLFHMLGYNYALSAGGHFTGWDVLGSFFIRNCACRKEEVLVNAATHFRQFGNMVRPVVSHTPNLGGTISDRQLYICETTEDRRWAFIVFIRLPGSLQAVVIPILDDPDGAARFYRFLRSGTSNLIVRLCKFEDGTFHAHPNTTTFEWPGIGDSWDSV